MINDVDYSLVKNLISSIPCEHYTDSTAVGCHQRKTPQDLIDENYESLVLDLIPTIDCQYHNEQNQVDITKSKFKKFLRETLNTDRIQKNNVLLSCDLWRNSMMARKRHIGSGYFQRSVNPALHRINYSELSITRSQSTPKSAVLTTIQFDFDKNPDHTMFPLRLTQEALADFEKIFHDLSTDSHVDALFRTADMARDFSIHQYWLPYGLDKKNMSSASLLLRYDHCNFKHKNGSMPRLYKEVYPEYVEEPHFHFNMGFGSIYKLSNDSGVHNYGVGYAIGVTGLKNYLKKLVNDSFDNESQRKLYNENDFGMPFLYILKSSRGESKIDEILHGLDKLLLAYHLNVEALEMEEAYNLTNMMSNSPIKFLEYKNTDEIRDDDIMNH